MVEEQQKCMAIDRGQTFRFHRFLRASAQAGKWVTVLEQPNELQNDYSRRTAGNQTCQSANQTIDRARFRRFALAVSLIFHSIAKQSNNKRNAQPSTHHDGPKTLHCPSYSLYSRRRFVDIFHRRPATSRCVEETISRDYHRRRRQCRQIISARRQIRCHGKNG